MKIKMRVFSVWAALLVVGCVSEEHEHTDKQAQQAELMAQVKVSKDDALKTALAKAPNGTIKEVELEKEHGQLIWSFDVATPGSKDITEVNVDAITGEVVSMGKETPEDQEKEQKEKKDDKD